MISYIRRMNFRALREDAQLTQQQLAERSGVQQTTISQLELGKVRDPQYSTVAALAEALNVPVEKVAKAIAATRAA